MNINDRDVVLYAEDLNQLLLEEIANCDGVEDLIKRGVVCVDGELYKTEKRDSYEECLK